MKRIIALICVIICCFSFWGCTSQATVYEFDLDKPWGYSLSPYEKSVYEVKMIQRIQNDGGVIDGTELARGEMVYELSSNTVSGLYYVKLTYDFSLTYNNADENGVNAGLTDVIKSEVFFMRDGMGVSSSKKTYIQAARKASVEKNAEYIDTDSYYVSADYATGAAEAKKGQVVDKLTGEVKNASGYKEEKSFSVTTGKEAFFDNEQLFYVARALSTTVPSSGVSVKIANLYEIAAKITDKGKYSNTSYNISVAEALVPVSLEPSYAENHLKAGEDSSYTVNCMQVNLIKNDSQPGTNISLLMSEPSVEFENKQKNKTRKLIVSIKTVHYDMALRAETSNIIYTLKDYTSIKSAE